MPAWQATGSAVSPAQYCPASQLAQTVAEVDVPEATCTLPAGQAPCGWHEVWLLLAEYWPGRQAEQVRSTVSEGVFVT